MSVGVGLSRIYSACDGLKFRYMGSATRERGAAPLAKASFFTENPNTPFSFIGGYEPLLRDRICY